MLRPFQPRELVQVLLYCIVLMSFGIRQGAYGVWPPVPHHNSSLPCRRLPQPHRQYVLENAAWNAASSLRACSVIGIPWIPGTYMLTGPVNIPDEVVGGLRTILFTVGGQ